MAWFGLGEYTPREGIDVNKDESVVPISGCFDHFSGRLDRLYGFDGPSNTGQGSPNSKWHLDEQGINRASWTAYMNRDPSSLLPGRINLNPQLVNVIHVI